MYEKLARGHATAYINSLQDYGRLLEWTEGPRPTKVMDALERSSYSKKPGRVLKRLAPLLRPQFRRVTIEEWTRQKKVIWASGLASSAENRVFRLPADTRPLYSERAAFMASLMMGQRPGKVAVSMVTHSSISHHAIARLVERGGVNPTSLSGDIELILEFCEMVAQMADDTAIDHSAMMSFMLPFRMGALVAVFMDMEPAQAHRSQNSRRVLSVRTWLDASKLSDLDMERMGGFQELVDDITEYEVGEEPFLRWMEGNVRPWKFSDSTLGDQGQGEVSCVGRVILDSADSAE